MPCQLERFRSCTHVVISGKPEGLLHQPVKDFSQTDSESLSTRPLKSNIAGCQLKEVCNWCTEEFPLTELRSHLLVCHANVFGDESDDENLNSSVQGVANNSLISTNSATMTNTVPAINQTTPMAVSPTVELGISQPFIQPTRVSVSAENEVNKITLSVSSPATPLNTVSDTSQLTSSSLVRQSTSDSVQSNDLTVNISEEIHGIIMYCHEKNLADNPVELLRCMQMRLVKGRALDVRNVAECEEGATSWIMVDRQKLLETGFDEIQLLPNKFLTLEVQFYNEVGGQTVYCFEKWHMHVLYCSYIYYILLKYLELIS